MSDEGPAGRPTVAASTAPPGAPSFPEPIRAGGPERATTDAGGARAPGAVAPGSPSLPATDHDDAAAPVETSSATATAEAPEPLKAPHTRASATYVAVGVGLLILVLVIIFIAQNLKKASVHFLSFHFKMPLGLLILASAVAGGLIVLMVSLARVLQLRLMARRHRKAYDHS
jgi:uncharacterized integral membrane protein